jgi:nucleoside triphosphate diphosphatase
VASPAEPAQPDVAAAVARLDALTRRLRRDCPWDREQDERSIVPHTVEEAYELADAAHGRDDAKLRDELGDVLFQVHFLSLLLEERGAGDMAQVADHCHAKLVRRHPHVFGEEAARSAAGQGEPETPQPSQSPGQEAARSAAGGGQPDAPQPSQDAGQNAPRSTHPRSTLSAAQVLRNWDAIKRAEPGREAGTFGDVPENLPALLHARKVQRRAAATGFDLPGVEGPLAAVEGQLEELAGAVAAAGADAGRGAAAGDDVRDGLFERVGDLLFAATNVARKLRVDPELALRSATGRFRARVEAAERLARQAGHDWAALSTDDKLSFYAHARLNETR